MPDGFHNTSLDEADRKLIPIDCDGKDGRNYRAVEMWGVEIRKSTFKIWAEFS
jgi:hypothetical protein